MSEINEHGPVLSRREMLLRLAAAGGAGVGALYFGRRIFPDQPRAIIPPDPTIEVRATKTAPPATAKPAAPVLEATTQAGKSPTPEKQEQDPLAWLKFGTAQIEFFQKEGMLTGDPISISFDSFPQLVVDDQGAHYDTNEPAQLTIKPHLGADLPQLSPVGQWDSETRTFQGGADTIYQDKNGIPMIGLHSLYQKVRTNGVSEYIPLSGEGITRFLAEGPVNEKTENGKKVNIPSVTHEQAVQNLQQLVNQAGKMLWRGKDQKFRVAAAVRVTPEEATRYFQALDTGRPDFTELIPGLNGLKLEPGKHILSQSCSAALIGERGGEPRPINQRYLSTANTQVQEYVSQYEQGSYFLVWEAIN